MKILSVDTSGRMGSIALADSEKLVAQTELNVSVTHAEKLLPAIEDILQKSEWKLSDLDGLALAIGPGSFTGLRVGLATLKGLAQGLEIPLVGISTLQALAYNGALSHLPIASILDAKRGEVYTSVYRFERCHLKETILKEQTIHPNLLCETLKTIGECWLIGDGALAYQKLFQEQLEGKVFFPPEPLMRVQAKWIAWLALPLLQNGDGDNWQGMVPNYLRLSDAEKKRTPIS